MRIALKIGYDGRKFNGFAMQPNKRTIEGEILKRLIKSKIIVSREKAKFQYAARTDKGVSAFGNVIAFNCSGNAVKVLESLDDIWLTGYAFVDENFNPKRCVRKIYRYYLFNEGYDIKKIKEAAKIFQGEHNFSNFAKLNGRNPKRKIDKINVQGTKIIKIDFIAKSFLWNQIRRIVAAIIKVGRSEADIENIKRLLECREKGNFGLAPAKYLVLVDIIYNFSFKKILPKEVCIEKEIYEDFLKYSVSQKVS